MENQRLQKQAAFDRAGRLIGSKNKLVKSMAGKMDQNALANSPKTMQRIEDLGARGDGAIAEVQELMQAMPDEGTTKGQYLKMNDILRDLNSGNVATVEAAIERYEKELDAMSKPPSQSQMQAQKVKQVKQTNPALAPLPDERAVTINDNVNTVISNISSSHTSPEQIERIDETIQMAREGDEDAIKKTSEFLGAKSEVELQAGIISLEDKLQRIKEENNAIRTFNLAWRESGASSNPAIVTSIDDDGNSRVVGNIMVVGQDGSDTASISPLYMPGSTAAFQDGSIVGYFVKGNLIPSNSKQVNDLALNYYSRLDTTIESLQDQSKSIKSRYRARARELDEIGQSDKADFLRQKIKQMDAIGISRSAIASRADELSEKKFKRRASVAERKFKESKSFLDKLSAAMERTGVSASQAITDIKSAVGFEEDPSKLKRAEIAKALDDFEVELNSIYSVR